jgi:hypothetical protein
MSHVEKIKSVKLKLSSKDGKELGYVKNNGVGGKSTMQIVTNEEEATVFDVMTYDKHTKSIEDPCYYKLKVEPKYYLDMHLYPKDLAKQLLFADKPNFSVSASTIAAWTLNNYLQTRVGGFYLGKIDGQTSLVAVQSTSAALKVSAVSV